MWIYLICSLYSQCLSNLMQLKLYELYFDEDTNGKIQALCEVFDIELNIFIVNTVRDAFYVIEGDLYQKDYDNIGKYYDVSKLAGIQLHSFQIFSAPSPAVSQKNVKKKNI